MCILIVDTSQSSTDLRNQRIQSYASSSSSSGVIGSYSKSLSQNLSRASSKSNCSTFESIDFNLVTSIDLAGSLPSCASNSTIAAAVSGTSGSATPDQSSDCSFYNSNNSCVYMPPVTSTSSMLSTKSTPYTDKRSPVHFRYVVSISQELLMLNINPINTITEKDEEQAMVWSLKALLPAHLDRFTTVQPMAVIATILHTNAMVGLNCSSCKEKPTP